ncbi:MAG: hypothetical protein A3F78_11155 [Burkholderiales bacterium RIFCSPLOWO2_12_FULL_61_40]|nr:MAG: hypothetical protein A3F78_11155 [Burkholderiales bacterium RIFCSPLOWO2_12_FULL_61_40]
MGTPIILDLNGDGVKTLGVGSGVKFDLFADGDSVKTGWVSSGDGLLVLDRNHDGQINDGAELFGSSTKLASGDKAADGYMALRELDSNQDGMISDEDAVFDELRVWVDSNSDGVSGDGEIKTLASLGITKISTQATVGTGTDNGNLVGLTSSYETSDGATHAAADVWFVTDRVASSENAVVDNQAALDNAIAALASTPAGVEEDTAPAETLSAMGPQTWTPDQKAPLNAEPKSDLRTRVSSLAQAIGSFGGSGAADDMLGAGVKLGTSGGVAASATAGALAAVGMADVMRQFDANGNMLGTSGTAAVSGKSLNLPGIQDPAGNGFLASGGK